MSIDEKVPKLTPLKEWCGASGLGYQRAYNLARSGHIDAIQLGTRWYVRGSGLPDGDSRATSGSQTEQKSSEEQE